jgi:hypothetical protein
VAIVTILKRDDRGPNFLQIPEDATVNGLFLQRPVETLSDAIRLRFSDEGEARRDTPEPDLIQEVISRVLRTVIHAQRQAPTNLGTRAANSPSSPCAIGCKAANRLPVLTAWMPTQQASQ